MNLSFEEIAALIAALAALGPTETDSATYRAQVESLKGRDKFEATVEELNIKGSKITGVKLSFPQGNEGAHDEHESHEEHHGHQH